MSKQIAKKGRTKLVSPPPTTLEPLRSVPQDDASMANWLKRFNALPLHQKSQIIKENKELSDAFYAHTALEGRLLLGPLTAEANQDSGQAEDTYLTVLKPLRDHLVTEYQLKTAAEYMLVDVLLLSYYQCIRAARSLFNYSAFNKSYNFETLTKHAQGYVIRANEMFLRNLEALRRMKAAPFIIKIEQAGQVNVGEKQINVAGKPPSDAADVILACDNSGATALSSANVGPRALPKPDEGP